MARGCSRSLQHNIMLELLNLFPRRPLAISIASWLFFFVVQIAFLSILAWAKYPTPLESTFSPFWDQMWFVYTELPKAIPMAAVYAVCMVFVAQVVGWFVSKHNPDNLTFGQWRELLRERPVKAAMGISIRVISGLAMAGLIVAFVVPGLLWLSPLVGLLFGMLLVPLMFDPWLKWFIRQLASRNGDGMHPDGH